MLLFEHIFSNCIVPLKCLKMTAFIFWIRINFWLQAPVINVIVH